MSLSPTLTPDERAAIAARCEAAVMAGGGGPAAWHIVVKDVPTLLSALDAAEARASAAESFVASAKSANEFLNGWNDTITAERTVLRAEVERLTRERDDLRTEAGALALGAAGALRAEVDAARAEAARIALERDDLQATFKLQQQADQRAIAAWQAAHPESAAMVPDRARMVRWLMEALSAAQEDARRAKVIRECIAKERAANAHDSGSQEALDAFRATRDAMTALRDEIAAEVDAALAGSPEEGT